MPVFWLSKEHLIFPDPHLASPEGILAIGGDLSAERLLVAYRHGIFPWFNPSDPILWWSPDPRFVLFPDELKVSRSMRPYFNQRKFGLTVDTSFRAVIRACAGQRRKGQGGGTWITDEMIDAYGDLHDRGIAHSVEVWKDDRLVGGLYGLALGRVFYGESMFAREPNASKFGFIALVRHLQTKGYWLIDCQQETRHLASLGARNITRDAFLDYLRRNENEPTRLEPWPKDLLG